MGPITFYALLLAFALVMLATLYAYPIIFLDRLTILSAFWDQATRLAGLLTTLLTVLEKPFAAILAWLLSGLTVCLLLYLWIKTQRVAAVVTLVLAIVWITGVFRYVQGTEAPEMISYFFQAFGIPPSIASSIIILALAMGVLVLPAIGFLRPPVTGLSVSLLWLLPWFILTFGLREYRAGAVLLLSLVLTSAGFLLGLYVTSGFLLPLPPGSHRGKAFAFLRDYVLRHNYPAYVVVDEPYEEDKVEERVPGSRFSDYATGPGFILSDCDHAVAVSSGIEFKGVQGPGVTVTGYADKVVQTVDLRPQLRAFHVEALSKDGIKVKVLAFLAFKIDARGRQPSLDEHLPYNKGAAFKAVHAQRIEHQGNKTEQRPWHDLPRMLAERILQNIISEYNFDDLYGPYQPGGDPPRKTIAKRFNEQLAAETEPLGIRPIGGGISDLEPADPQEVYIKRAHSWQAEWTRKITLRKAEGQAEWLRMVERARAEAQADLILSVGRQLEELSAARRGLRPEEAIRLLMRVLGELMSQQPTLAQVVPPETLQRLQAIGQAIAE